MDTVERFSNRVENYVRYRPRYPAAILDCLRANCGLSAASVVADIGSGTGFLTELFLQNGNTVYGVEPNAKMRAAGEQVLAGYPNFHSVDGTAENTTLPAGSVDFVTAGQAFHWFDRDKAKAEFRRVLQPGGWVALVWNEQRGDSDFGSEYRQILGAYAPEYKAVTQRNIGEEVMGEFFGAYRVCAAENVQTFDFEGLKGRALSSSYAPEVGHPQHDGAMQALKALFDRHQVDGRVQFEYDTHCYYGQLAGA